MTEVDQNTGLYIQSTKPGGQVKFRILSYDPATKKGRIIGSMGKAFDCDLSKENLFRTGYTVVRGDVSFEE